MSFQRSKEDHIGLISKSIFVTNFPDDVGSSDLWKVCEGYGKVVDVFIPNRRSKAGKRFAFVRFIRVDNIDRLVQNLCTIWIGRFHLHANVVRFERASKHVTLANNTQSKVHGNVGSYATAVRGKTPLNVPVTPVSSTPALVLDEACAITRDLSCHVMGKVKDINSISNLQTLLAKEGFPKAKLTFLGGLWVMIELDSEATKCSLLDHVGVNSWFQSIQDASHDFVSDECVVWVDLEGVPLNLWSRETFLKIGNKWGEALDIEDNYGSSFACKRLCVLTKQPDSILEKFKVIYKGRVFLVHAKELFTWTPIFLEPQEMGYTSDGESVHGENKQPGGLQLSNEESDGDSDVDGVPDTVFGDNSFSHHAPRDDDLANETTVNGVDNENTSAVNAQVMNNSQEVPDSAKVDSTSLNSGPIHNGGSILDVLEDMIK
ncbi:RNA-directed DNA polymerase, eukaryota, partial [Tanacetum coccineum]